MELERRESGFSAGYTLHLVAALVLERASFVSSRRDFNQRSGDNLLFTRHSRYCRPCSLDHRILMSLRLKLSTRMVS